MVGVIGHLPNPSVDQAVALAQAAEEAGARRPLSAATRWCSMVGVNSGRRVRHPECRDGGDRWSA